jgi:predicted peptidase
MDACHTNPQNWREWRRLHAVRLKEQGWHQGDIAPRRDPSAGRSREIHRRTTEMKRLIAMSICSILLAGEARAQAPATNTKKKAEVDQRLLKLYEAREFQGMPYRLMKPVDRAPETSYPLIVTLHGAAGRGNDNLKSIQAPCISIMARDELRREHPCFVLAPQSDRGWSSADEKEPELTEETIKGYPEALQGFYKRRLAGAGRGARGATSRRSSA